MTGQKLTEQDLKEQSEELSWINTIIMLGNETTSLQMFIEKTFQYIFPLLNFSGGGIYLYDSTTKINILTYYKNIHPEFIELAFEKKMTEDPSSKFQKKKLHICKDASIEYGAENAKKWNLSSYIGIPIIARDEYKGNLNLFTSQPRTFQIRELDFFKSIGRQIGIIIKKFESEKLLKESEEKYRKAYYQANLYRDIFAHDINNILQNISSSAELSSLYLNNPEKLHTLKELYEIINEQVNRGKKLINNVRKITEIDDSEVIVEKVDANRLLKNAIEFMHTSFQTRNIDIQLNNPTKNIYVIANNLLLDVFENILINAVRYNDKSKIEIIIDISKEEIDEKKFIKMEFKDNGIGISDYRKNNIFERGSRKRYKSKGMGLGLSLVRKIIDTYNGDIWVEDRVKGEYRQGSNFVVLIPSNH